MMWHIKKMEDPTYELSIGQTVPDDEITRVLEEWKTKMKRDEGRPPLDVAKAGGESAGGRQDDSAHAEPSPDVQE